jgi:hypothetical protein
VYRRAGKTFPIEPCLWLFAGTKDPRDATGTETMKASDFVSRLTLKPVHLKPPQIVNTPEDRLENVYLGVAMLRAEFPDVREVSLHVLDAFHQLEASLSIREFRHFTKDFVDINSGEVRFANVPTTWFSKLGIAEIPMPLLKETLVEIKGQAVSPNVYARFSPGSIQVRAAG